MDFAKAPWGFLMSRKFTLDVLIFMIWPRNLFKCNGHGNFQQSSIESYCPSLLVSC